MNKVYSCAFLSALDKNTFWLLFHVHVLSSGDESSSSTHCKSYCFSSGDQMRKKIQKWEKQTGEEDEFLSAGGLMSYQQQGATRTDLVLFS